MIAIIPVHVLKIFEVKIDLRMSSEIYPVKKTDVCFSSKLCPCPPGNLKFGTFLHFTKHGVERNSKSSTLNKESFLTMSPGLSANPPISSSCDAIINRQSFS